MRKPKSFTYVLFIAYPIIFMVAMALLKLPGHELIEPFQYFGWLSLILCAVVFVMPWGRRVLESDTPATKRPFWQWIGLVLALQASLLCVFLGTHYFIFDVLPVAQKPFALHMTLHSLWWQWGLFPWGFIALLAVHYAYVAFNKKQDAYLPRSLYPLFKFKDNSLFARILQVTVRNAITLVLGLSFAIIGMWTAQLLADNSTLTISHGMNTTSFLTAIAIFLITFLPPVKRGIAKLVRRRIPGIMGIIAICAVMGVAILLFSTLFSTIPNANSGTPNYKILHELQHLGSKNLWLLFSVSWWTAWTPICATFIAYFSRGRSIRACILACIIPPALFIIALHVMIDQLHLSLSLPHTLIYLLSAIGFITLILIITKRKTQGLLVYSYVPNNGTLKYRDHHLLYRRAFQIAAAIIYLYLPAGLPFVVYMMIIALLPVNGLIILSVIALVKRLACND
jgi:choline-glycine betaine transporter